MKEFVRVEIEPDEEGLVGRECPIEKCNGYFKIQLGTGLTGEGLKCHCPYCGHADEPNQFFTKEQMDYVHSIALKAVGQEFTKMLKKFESKPKRSSFVTITTRVTSNPYPIHYYREKKLEQEIVCNNCTLRYAIYGVFGYCPDCRVHNSLQILIANFDIVTKLLNLADETADIQLKEKLIEDSLENAVSSLDGFGREFCKVNASKSTEEAKALNVSFQAISATKDKVKNLFNIDIQTPFNSMEWAEIERLFQKRHLISHKMGVIDQEYIDKANVDQVLLGRKVLVNRGEVQLLLDYLTRMAQFLSQQLNSIP